VSAIGENAWRDFQTHFKMKALLSAGGVIFFLLSIACLLPTFLRSSLREDPVGVILLSIPDPNCSNYTDPGDRLCRGSEKDSDVGYVCDMYDSGEPSTLDLGSRCVHNTTIAFDCCDLIRGSLPNTQKVLFINCYVKRGRGNESGVASTSKSKDSPCD
jgi:hypothetical protein